MIRYTYFEILDTKGSNKCLRSFGNSFYTKKEAEEFLTNWLKSTRTKRSDYRIEKRQFDLDVSNDYADFSAQFQII